MQIDESLAIAVFLLAQINALRAEFESARKHLRGLYLVLQQMQSKYRREVSPWKPTVHTVRIIDVSTTNMETCHQYGLAASYVYAPTSCFPSGPYAGGIS